MIEKLHPDDLRALQDLLYRHYILGDKVMVIAAEIGISRSKAQNLLRYARKNELIETTILLQGDPMDELKLRVKAEWKEYGVESVIVLAGPADDTNLNTPQYRTALRRGLGALAAKYVASLELQPGAHIAIGGGRTCTAFAQRYSPPMRQLIVRPLAVGGRWCPIVHVDSAAVVQIILSRLGYPPGRGTSVLCPEMPPGRELDYRSRPEVQAVFGVHAPRPSVTLCSIGRRHYQPSERSDGFGPHPDTSAYVQLYATTGYYLSLFPKWKRARRQLEKKPLQVYIPLPDLVYADANKDLEKRKIIADVCRHGINEVGDIVPTFLEEASLAISPRQLRSWREIGTDTVVAVGGSDLAPALRAAIRGRYFRTLIIDTAMAIQLIPRERRPEPFRDVPEVVEVA
jgi:DNA-binding transcriptional regulator LsrR (DeoR family)